MSEKNVEKCKSIMRVQKKPLFRGLNYLLLLIEERIFLITIIPIKIKMLIMIITGPVVTLV